MAKASLSRLLRLVSRLAVAGIGSAVLGVSAASILGGEPSALPLQKEYRQRVWTRQHGLPSNAIQALIQTRDGYLWVATRSGLARFDGLRFSVFNRQNTTAFKGDECTALAEDSVGSLWIGTTKGLVVFRDGRFTDYSVADGLWDNHVTALCALADGEVWVGTRKGPTRFHNRTFTRFPPRDEIIVEEDKLTRVLYKDRKGTLWIGSTSGIQRWDRESECFQEVLFATSTSEKSGVAKHFV